MGRVGIDFYDPFTYIGFTGAFLILFGFYRTSIGRWKNKSLIYEADNLLGATLLVIYQLHYHIYVTLVLNLVWAIVAVRGITSWAERRIVKNYRKNHRR